MTRLEEHRDDIERRITDRTGTTIAADGSGQARALARFLRGVRDPEAVRAFEKYTAAKQRQLRHLETTAELGRPRDPATARAKLDRLMEGDALAETLRLAGKGR